MFCPQMTENWKQLSYSGPGTFALFLILLVLFSSICLTITTPPPQADMGMTYSELSVIGRLRKISKCGPFSMFCKLIHTWKDALSPAEVSQLLHSVGLIDLDFSARPQQSVILH